MSSDKDGFAKNDLFFSDAISIEIDKDFVRKLPTSAFSLEGYKTRVMKHLDEIAQVMAANPDLEQPYLSFSYDFEINPKENSAVSGHRVLKLHLNGARAWPKEKIEEFNKVVKDEKDEVTELKELIKKYPGKAMLFLATLVEEK